MSEANKTGLTPEMAKLIQEQIQQAQKGEGFWSFLKKSATDESGNASSSRVSMYAQIGLAAICLGLGVYFAFQGNATLAITFLSTAAGFGGFSSLTNASAQKKAAAIKAAQVKESPNPEAKKEEQASA